MLDAHLPLQGTGCKVAIGRTKSSSVTLTCAPFAKRNRHSERHPPPSGPETQPPIIATRCHCAQHTGPRRCLLHRARAGQSTAAPHCSRIQAMRWYPDPALLLLQCTSAARLDCWPDAHQKWVKIGTAWSRLLIEKMCILTSKQQINNNATSNNNVCSPPLPTPENQDS